MLRTMLARIFRPDSLPSREWTPAMCAAAIRSVTDLRTGEHTRYTVQRVARDARGRVRCTVKLSNGVALAA